MIVFDTLQLVRCYLLIGLFTYLLHPHAHWHIGIYITFSIVAEELVFNTKTTTYKTEQNAQLSA